VKSIRSSKQTPRAKFRRSSGQRVFRRTIILARKQVRGRHEAVGARPSRHGAAPFHSFAAGNTIFLMGSLHDSMIAIIDGEVKISMASAAPASLTGDYQKLIGLAK
jgi:hypothetical protein